MMIVAFFGEEILSQFFVRVEDPSVETAVFDFCDVIVWTNEELQSLVFCLYCL